MLEFIYSTLAINEYWNNKKHISWKTTEEHYITIDKGVLKKLLSYNTIMPYTGDRSWLLTLPGFGLLLLGLFDCFPNLVVLERLRAHDNRLHTAIFQYINQ